MRFRDAVNAYLSQNEEIYRERLIFHLDSNKIQEDDWEGVYALLSEAPSARVRCFAWLSILANQHNKEEVYSRTGLKPEEFFSLSASNMRRAFFPVVNSAGCGKIAEALVFPFKSENPKAVALKNGHNGQASLLASLTGLSFVIAFTEDFEGDSWMASALAALVCKNPERLYEICFSGKVLENGTILAPAAQDAKCACSLQAGKRLVCSADSLEEFDFWLNASEIPIPVVQTTGAPEKRTFWLGKMEITIQKDHPLFSLASLYEFTGLQEQNICIFHEGDFPHEPGFWQKYLGSVSHFDDIGRKLTSQKPIFWYAGMISSLQFGIGAIFGFKRPVCICHWDPGEQQYAPVIRLYGNTSARSLKNVSLHPGNFAQIHYELDIPSQHVQDMALILYFGSHNPRQDALNFLQGVSDDHGSVFVSLQSGQGEITMDSDWLGIVKETNSLINYLKRDYYWQRLHIFQTSPNPICMALGIALGHFIPATIYHYQPQAKEKYLGVYDLEMVLRYQN